MKTYPDESTHKVNGRTETVGGMFSLEKKDYAKTSQLSLKGHDGENGPDLFNVGTEGKNNSLHDKESGFNWTSK